MLEGRTVTLVEKDEKYIDVIRTRLNRPFPKPPPRDRKTNDELLMEFPE